MPAPVLQFKRGNAGVAGTVPALRPGEPAISLNNFDFFIGIDTSVANNKFFGSHRYWGREDGSTALRLKLVDKDGTNSVNIKAPDTLAGITTYTLPGTPVDGYFLKTNSTGTLSWEQVVSNINIAADSGTPDSVSTGSTITFVGGTNVNTAVTNDTITINLDDYVSLSNLNVSVAATFASANVSDLTSGRVVLAGANGSLEDSSNLTFDGSTLTVNGQIVTNSGVSTFTGSIDAQGGITGNLTGTATTASRAFGVDVVGVATNQNYYITLVDGSGNAKGIGVDAELLYNPNTNILSVPQIKIGTGAGVTQFSSAVGSGNSTSSVPTSSAVIDYVNVVAGNVDLTFGINADSGGPSTVNTSQTLTISGTANEVETSVSGQTITVGLPNNVTIGNDLTVSGNLYVNGSTTQVNTASLTVEDRTIELGMVDGSAPSSSTTWDLGVLFNYHDGAAKKSALVWEQNDTRFKLGSVVTDGGGTGNSNPQLTVSTYAALEISDLWINNTCTGGSSQVIGCVGSELQLQNIVVDAGLF